MSTGKRQPEDVVPSTAEATIADGCVVVVGSADNAHALPGGADPTSGVMGIAMLAAVASSGFRSEQDVCRGGVYPGIVAAGKTATRGLFAAIDGTTGHVKDATPAAVGAGTRSMVVGMFVETGTAGQRVGIQVMPQIVDHT